MGETINHNEDSKSNNEAYNIWQQKMSEAKPFNSTEQSSNHEKVIELSDHDATTKLYKILNAEHKQLLKGGNTIDGYGGTLHSFEYGDRVGLPGDALVMQMDALIDAENRLNDPDEYGETDTTMSDVLNFDRNDILIAWQTSKDKRGASDPHTTELERRYNIANDLFFRFKKAKIEEIESAPTEQYSDEGMKKEEIPAGKTNEQIAAEQAKKAKADAEFKARMEAYMTEKRIREQKQREQNEQIKAKQREAEAKRQQIINEQREKVRAAYHQDMHDELEEEQEMEM